ncbi:Protein of unknown function [Catalinimonas alkaloidigena]|uniref:DUF2628 domain-containing protein n=1 Tax=Catalinimonas alkaloidigena TaxID=1075417 RepID=A0A1G9G975_9BACT|nr:DUF2628 domain-containing protein [Catalinimonas alkaloidigena]SDK97125.1 Protein of unknown function [Catalinimonas alkaloidigena]
MEEQKDQEALDREEYFRAYFGQSADYYWQKVEEYGDGRTYTFNVFAFVFGLSWMLYRKMYRPMVVLLGLILLSSALESSLWMRLHLSEATIEFIGNAEMVAWAFLMGFLGNNLYLKQAARTIESVTDELDDKEHIKARLAQLGGVTLRPHLLILLFLIGAMLLMKFGVLPTLFP